LNVSANVPVALRLIATNSAPVGAPPQVNVIGTAIFIVALGVMLANVVAQNRRARSA